MTKFGISALPISWAYGAIINLRHLLYNSGVFKSQSTAQVFTICVGNLNLGGSGKTPTAEYLISQLKFQYKVGVVSRGYGRKSTGFYIVDPQGSSEQFGDEPLQMAQKFSDVPFAVSENRYDGINKLLEFRNDLQVIILDDAFQHRKFSADYNLLLTQFDLPFFRDNLIPAGGLRDIKAAATRAHSLLITKSPQNISHDTKKIFQRESGFTLERNLFFTHLKYQQLLDPINNENLSIVGVDQALVVCGLANPKPLFQYLESKVARLKKVKFRDHYEYQAKDIHAMRTIFDNFARTNDRIVITTEKDYVKLQKLKHLWPDSWTVLVLPIQMEFNNGMDTRFLDGLTDRINTKLESHDR